MAQALFEHPQSLTSLTTTSKNDHHRCNLQPKHRIRPVTVLVPDNQRAGDAEQQDLYLQLYNDFSYKS